MQKFVSAVLMMTLGGCAGSVSGTVGGVSLSVSDAIFAVIKDNDGKSRGAVVLLSDAPRLCENYKANREAKGSTNLLFTLYRLSDTDVLAPDVGEYTVTGSDIKGAGFHAGAIFGRNDANCVNTIASTARDGKSGLITVKSIKSEAGGGAGGSFDVTFGSGDKLTGNFNASYCDITTIHENPNCE